MEDQTWTAKSQAELHQFIGGLPGLPAEELRQAKVLYLRNELTDLQAYLEQARTFGVLQILFAIIPLFWPILLAQRASINSERRQRVARIRNALAVWGHDLGPERAALERELEALAGS